MGLDTKRRLLTGRIVPLYARLPLRFRRMLRIALIMTVDALCVLFALFAALVLRFDLRIPEFYIKRVTAQLPWLIFTYLAILYLFRQYNTMWRYAGGRELLLQALTVAGACAATLLWNHLFSWGLPRTVLLGAGLFIIALVTASRLFARSLRARMKHLGIQTGGSGKVPLLIVGAGDAASFILTQIRRGGSAFGTPRALVDDAPEKRSMRVQNVPVMGGVEDIPHLVEQLGIREIIIAMPSVRGGRLQEIVEICNSTRCQVRILSDPQEVGTPAGGRGGMVLRTPNLEDFLSREVAEIDDSQVGAFLRGKVVLVTGGGGSIGAEICRQVMRFEPRQLLVLDVYENCAYELLVELQGRYGRDCPVTVLVGSVRDRARLDEVMAAYRPGVIFHTAAHKHVPLMELSPVEAVKNNVLGTLNVLESGEQHGVERFVMLSTDKAVNSKSVMGASKRAAEIVMQRFARESSMRCCAVRFGNVLGSHGSVIPLFESQIRSGGPLTLTHPDITRYFMTIREAATLVLQAGSTAQSGRIYVLDMGQPVRIIDLARKLIRFYGFDPESEMQI